MPSIINAFNGKLNLDVAEYRIDNGDYIDALNITRDSQGQGQDRIVANILGNTNVSYTLPIGQNKVIGGYSDKLRNRYYFFVWNSSGKHGIYYYSQDDGTITNIIESETDSDGVDILSFDPSYKIFGVNIIYRDDSEGDLLFFNDGINEPRVINVDATYSSWREEYLSVAKAPPQMPPKSTYENDTDVKVNNLRNAIFQFRYRFEFDNFEKSVYSSAGKVTLPNQDTLQLTDNTFTNNSRISVSMSTGGVDVTKIELNVRQTKDGITSDWLLVDVFDKSELSISDNDIYTFRFYNDGLYSSVDLNESLLLQDLVPQKANAQEIINGNTLIYGAITEGYDELETDMSVTVNQNGTGFFLNYCGLLFFAQANGVDSGVAGATTLKIYLYGTGTNTSGTVTTLNNAAANYVINAINGAGTSIGVTVPNPTVSIAVATLLGAVSTALQANGFVQVSLVGNILTMSFAAGFTLLSSGVQYLAPGGQPDNTKFAYAFESGYEYAIQYFDERGRTNGALTNITATFNTPRNTGVDFSQPRLSISHRPPLWAVYYQILRSNNTTYNKIFYWVSVSAYSNISNANSNEQFAYLGISNIDYYNRLISSTQSVVSYNFQAGDRVRILSRFDEDNVQTSLTVVDYEVLGTEVNPVISGIIKEGTFVKIKYPTADINASMRFDGTSDYQHYEILLYNYTANQSNQTKPYFEFGECYGIGNAGTVNAYHIGLNQTQTSNLATPALIDLVEGDLFYRKRNVPTGAQYTFNAGLFNSNQQYVSFAIVVPNSPVTVGTSYRLATQNVIQGGLGLADYPTNANTNNVYQNNSGASASVRFKGTFRANADLTAGVQLIAKLTSAGATTNTPITGTFSLPTANTEYEFSFDSTVLVPANNKLWVLLYLTGQTATAPIVNIGAFDLEFEVQQTAQIEIIESSFSDVFQLVTNSNGRASVIEENAKQTYYPTLVRFGQSYQADTSVNGTNRFYGENFDTYDRGFGDIMRLHVRDRYMKVYQKLKVGNVPVLTQIVKDVQGNPLQANSDQLINKIQYYAGDYGIGDSPTSLAWDNFADYFVDDFRGVVCRLSQDGITPISILYTTNSFFASKLKAYRKSLNNGIAPTGQTYAGDACIYGAFDAFTNKYILAMEQITRYSDPNTISFQQDGYTISFDEISNAFESFYSYKPEWLGCLNTLLISFKTGGLWKHDSITYCNFYGTQYEASITAVFNANSLDKKTFVSLMETSNTTWQCPAIYTQMNTYGTQRQESVLGDVNFRVLESQYHAFFKRDSNSSGGLINGKTLKGNYIVIKFQKDSANQFYFINSCTVNYINSALNKR